MEQISYAGFSAALHRRGAAAQLPLNVTFELTRRCPLACAHCYNNLPVGDRAAQGSELSTDEHKRLLDELAELGCMWLLYTGGEILARADFFDIYAHAKARGFLITLFTNGTQVTEAVADKLAALPPFAIEITLYGGTRETYERVTGVRGSFDRCRRGVDLLLARKLPLRLKTVALTLNQHELDDMRRFAQERGCEFKFDAMMSPRLDCSLSPLEVRLRPEETVALDLRDARRMHEWGLFVDRFASMPAPPAEDLYVCGGGVKSFSVDPYGGMSICVLSEREKYDLRTGTVAEGWTTFLRQVRKRKVTRATKCTTCALKPLCGMCPAHGELESQDPEKPVDYLCEVAHLRARALGLEVPPHAGCEYCAGGERHEAIGQAFDRLQAAVALPPKPDRRRPAGLSVVREAAQGCASGSCGSCGDHQVG